MLTREMEKISDARMEDLIQSNILTKITNQIVNDANRQLKEMAMDESVVFPLKEEMSLNESISAEVEATRLNDRVYYLGTDYQGRDMLSRIIYGGQVSIAIGFVGTITSVLIGIILGALAGYLGGKVDYIIMRIVDIMYGLPYMLLVIIAMAIFGRNILNLFFALAIISWLTVSRMVQGTDNVTEESGIHRSSPLDGSFDLENHFQAPCPQLPQRHHCLLYPAHTGLHHDREFPQFPRSR